MPLTEDEQRNVVEWLEQHSQVSPAPACPVCGVRDWGIQNSIYALKEVERKEGQIMVKSAEVPGGQEAKVLVAASCKNCGNTMLFDAQKVGVDV